MSGRVSDRPKCLADLEILNIELGRGSFGIVQKVRFHDHDFALKSISRKAIADGFITADRVRTERRVHRKMSHGSIVRFISAFEDADHVHFVLELCRHGSLFQLMKSGYVLSPLQIKSVVSQVARGLHYMHRTHGCVHRDVKLTNILVSHVHPLKTAVSGEESSIEVKLCDFGLAKSVADSEIIQPNRSATSRKHAAASTADQVQDEWTFCGTPGYMSPENALNGSGSSDKQAPDKGNGLFGSSDAEVKSRQWFGRDAWSLGVVMFALHFGKLPFASASKQLVNSESISKDTDFSKNPFSGLMLPNSRVSADCLDLMRKLLDLDWRSRISVSEVLRHPYVLESVSGPPNLFSASLSMSSGFSSVSSNQTNLLSGSSSTSRVSHSLTKTDSVDILCEKSMKYIPNFAVLSRIGGLSLATKYGRLEVSFESSNVCSVSFDFLSSSKTGSRFILSLSRFATDKIEFSGLHQHIEDGFSFSDVLKHVRYVGQLLSIIASHLVAAVSESDNIQIFVMIDGSARLRRVSDGHEVLFSAADWSSFHTAHRIIEKQLSGLSD
eukprot:ANDGO_07654.mRNA.1 Serine/threonine-protein kinase PLK4